MNIALVPEKEEDIPHIEDLLELAFAFDTYSRQNEAQILRELRKSQNLLLSLLAREESGEVVGQIAFSPVMIQDGSPDGIHDWIGLGPMSVNPRLQRQGIGRELIEAGLEEMKNRGAGGCVVLGEPGFYERFGFKACPDLILPGALAPFFMANAFEGGVPQGQVAYDDAFQTTGSTPY